MNHEEIMEKCQNCEIYYELTPNDVCPYLGEFMATGNCKVFEAI